MGLHECCPCAQAVQAVPVDIKCQLQVPMPHNGERTCDAHGRKAIHAEQNLGEGTALTTSHMRSAADAATDIKSARAGACNSVGSPAFPWSMIVTQWVVQDSKPRASAVVRSNGCSNSRRSSHQGSGRATEAGAGATLCSSCSRACIVRHACPY